MGIYNYEFNNWQKFANQELKWFCSDNEKNYQRNLKTNFKMLDELGWIDSNITYKFNSQGFRCQEFVDDSILFLGCSFTQGIGVPVDLIFPTLISNQLKMPCSNLGITRISADTAFRLSKVFLHKLKPKIVIAVLMYPYRHELLTSKMGMQLLPNIKFQDQDSYSKLYYAEYYGKWIEQPENYELNYLKNIYAINQLCDDLNIKFVSVASLMTRDEAANYLFHPQYRGRDLIHPGVVIHQKLSDLILNNI